MGSTATATPTTGILGLEWCRNRRKDLERLKRDLPRFAMCPDGPMDDISYHQPEDDEGQ